MRLLAAIAPFVFAALAGCSTTQTVVLAKASPPPIRSVAQVPQDGNSAEMTANVSRALQQQGLAIKAPLAVGTRTAADVDAIVSYGDTWRWDIVMFLRALTIQVYDGKTGDLLATGDWKNSPAHSYPNSREIVEGLLAEMMTKLREASKAASP